MPQVSAPNYCVSKRFGLLRTDASPAGYGKAVKPAQIITLAAQRGARLKQEKQA